MPLLEVRKLATSDCLAIADTQHDIMMAGFGLSVLLSSFVIYAVRRDTDMLSEMPLQCQLVQILCTCDLVLAGVSCIGWAVAELGLCKMADELYNPLVSMVMVVQLLAFVSTAAIAYVLGRTIAHPLSIEKVPRRLILAVGTACTLPGVVHLGICAALPNVCPTQCGYSNVAGRASGYLLERANELTGVLIALCSIIVTVVRLVCSERTSRVVRNRMIRRQYRFLAAFTLLWSAVMLAALTEGAGPSCVWRWLLQLQGFQGTLNALLLSPQAVALPMCCVRPLERFVAFSRRSTDPAPPPRLSVEQRNNSLRRSRARVAAARARASASGKPELPTEHAEALLTPEDSERSLSHTAGSDDASISSASVNGIAQVLVRDTFDSLSRSE